MQVTFLGGNGDPSAGYSEIANVPGEYESEQQSRKEQPQTNDSQLRHLDPHYGGFSMQTPHSFWKYRSHIRPVAS